MVLNFFTLLCLQNPVEMEPVYNGMLDLNPKIPSSRKEYPKNITAKSETSTKEKKSQAIPLSQIILYQFIVFI